MKKISRRNFLLASGAVTHWCSSGCLRRQFRLHQHRFLGRCFFCRFRSPRRTG